MCRRSARPELLLRADPVTSIRSRVHGKAKKQVPSPKGAIPRQVSRTKFQAPRKGAAPFENETSVTSAVIVATANDGSVTAKERSRSPIGRCHTRGLQSATVCLVGCFRHPYAGTAPSQSRLCHWRLLDDLLPNEVSA